MSSLNPLIFKAISILFEETSQQFESGASGGRREERRKREGKLGGTREEGNWVDDRLPVLAELYLPETSHPKMSSSLFLRVRMGRKEEKSLRLKSGP